MFGALLDAWTNVFQVPGTRTTGTKAQTYAITGPGQGLDVIRKNRMTLNTADAGV